MREVNKPDVIADAWRELQRVAEVYTAERLIGLRWETISEAQRRLCAAAVAYANATQPAARARKGKSR